DPALEVRSERHPDVEQVRPGHLLLAVHAELARGRPPECAGRRVHRAYDLVVLDHQQDAALAVDLEPAPGVAARSGPRTRRPCELDLEPVVDGACPVDSLPALERE